MLTSINCIRTSIGLPAKESEKEKGFRCSTGDYWGFCDGNDILANGQAIIYEIEEGQKHPSTNVLKYWPVLEENPEIKFILIQWLSKTPKSKNRWQLAKFVGEKMALAFPDRFQYVYLEFNNSDNETKLQKIKQQILSFSIQ